MARLKDLYKGSVTAELVKEFGYKKAAYVTAFEIVFATVLGGIVLRVLTLFM